MIKNHKEIGRKISKWAGMRYVGYDNGKYLAQREVIEEEKVIDENTTIPRKTMYEVWDITKAMLNK